MLFSYFHSLSLQPLPIILHIVCKTLPLESVYSAHCYKNQACCTVTWQKETQSSNECSCHLENEFPKRENTRLAAAENGWMSEMNARWEGVGVSSTLRIDVIWHSCRAGRGIFNVITDTADPIWWPGWAASLQAHTHRLVIHFSLATREQSASWQYLCLLFQHYFRTSTKNLSMPSKQLVDGLHS